MSKCVLCVSGNNSPEVTDLVERLKAAGYEVKRVRDSAMSKPVVSDENNGTYRGREITLKFLS